MNKKIISNLQGRIHKLETEQVGNYEKNNEKQEFQEQYNRGRNLIINNLPTGKLG